MNQEHSETQSSPDADAVANTVADARRRRQTLIGGGLLLVAIVVAAVSLWVQRERDQDRSRRAVAFEDSRRQQVVADVQRQQARAIVTGRGLTDEYLAVPLASLRSGVPAIDLIPALETTAIGGDVTFTPLPELPADTRVIGVTVDGEHRAYPLAILDYHEVVNDEVAGVPIAVVYCPLCDSATVFRRPTPEMTFGVSGLLHESNVVLYDRVDNALWSQLRLQAISGPRVGETLETVSDWTITTLADWQRTSPGGLVLSKQTGHDLPYDQPIYEDFRAGDGTFYAMDGLDDRLPLRELVIGIRRGDYVMAYPLAKITKPVTDAETGTRLVPTGEAGIRIESAPADVQTAHAFWFSWAKMHPETRIFGEDARGR